MPQVRSFLAVLTPMLLAGCGGGAERTMLITSDPPGALVWMNDEEIGRTPLRQEFTSYGNYDVVVRSEGHETLKTNTWVVAPWWQWPPIDLAVEFLPFRIKDEHRINYVLQPASTEPAEPSAILSRAEALRQQLESSRHRQPRSASATPGRTTP